GTKVAKRRIYESRQGLNMDEKKAAIESLIYRGQRLDAKYEQIRNLLSGSDASFTYLIKTSSGRYSRTKIDKLIKDLVESLKEYRSYREAQKRSISAKMEPVTLKKKEQDFFEAYFHMMIGLSLYNNDGPDAKLKAPGTWSAIRERIEAIPTYKKRAKLYRDMICFENIGYLDGYPTRHLRGFFYDLSDVYERLTGEYLSDLITGTDRKEAFALMTKEEADLIKKEEKEPGTISDIRAQKEEEWSKVQEAYWEEH
ncbi:MAG: hypothetical protein IK088_01970, partial [Lachnospiraceae bacterium]|nr:hypothetical protein [Lachnospiraceae bacterium]